MFTTGGMSFVSLKLLVESRPKIINEPVEDSVLSFSLPYLFSKSETTVYWWSRHPMTENQGVALCLAHCGGIEVISKNLYFVNPDHFVESIKEAEFFPYVVAPNYMIQLALKKGLRFGYFEMRYGPPYGFVHAVYQCENGLCNKVVTGLDIYRYMKRYNL